MDTICPELQEARNYKKLVDDALKIALASENQTRSAQAPILLPIPSLPARTERHVTNETIKQIAISLKCSPNTVRNRLNLLSLHDPVIKLLETGRIHPDGALQFSGLTPEQTNRVIRILQQGTPTPYSTKDVFTARYECGIKDDDKKKKLRTQAEVEKAIERMSALISDPRDPRVVIIHVCRWFLGEQSEFPI